MNLKQLAVAVLSALLLVDCSSERPSEPIEDLAQTLPSGFTKTSIASGLSLPTGLTFAPDGRMFVLERGTSAGGTGRVRIVKNGQLLSTPFVSIPVNNVTVSADERGLLGIALDPSFASNHFVYVYYTTTASTPYNRISRFTANGDVAVSGSEVLVLRLDDLSAGNHNGGALAFGKDGKLYVGVGENHNAANAIDLSNYLGKVLRINSDGSAPSDNPFYNAGDGISARDRIWTYGMRNPWRLAVQPGTGRIFADDVGESTWEEINDIVKGKDYGWRGGTTDGDSTVWYKYDHNTGKCITGGTFYNPPSAPGGFSAYVGKYFFTDYANGWIKAIDTSTKAVSTFDTGINGPTDIQVGPDGNLYYVAYGSGEVWRISSTTAQQSLILSDAALAVNEGATKPFTVRLAMQPSGNVSVAVSKTSGDTSITFSPTTLTFTTSNWSTPQTVTVAAAQDADSINGTAVITVSSSGLTAQTVSVTALDDDVTAPVVQITAPTNGSVVRGTNVDFYGGSNLDGSAAKGEFYIDGVLAYTDIGPGHYHYLGSHSSWDTTLLGEGMHALRLTVYDTSNRAGSDEIAVTVDNLPGAWNHQDIGSVGAKGSASAAGGIFTVKGAGADIWGTADAFHYVHQPMTGDGEITARVTGVQLTNAWSKAGVMIRESLAANSKQALMLLSGGGNVAFQRRLTTGGSSVSTASTAGTSPLWVRVRRAGSTFTAFRSPDGANWTQVGSETITMTSTVFVGLAIASHADPTLAQATFDNVSAGGSTCSPESDTTFCSRLAKNCGTVSGTDNCGAARTVSSCGTCTSPQTCGGGGTANVCGGGSCTSETDAAFCTRLAKNCGTVSGTDNCGAARTVSSCGTCTSPQTCGGGGAANVCGTASLWSSQDVGAVAAAGSFSQSGTTYTVSGSGADVYGMADEFRYAYQNVTGDATITARIASIQNVAAWSKAGVMVRDGLTAGATNVFMLASPTATNNYRWQTRTAAGGSSNSTAPTSTACGNGTAPVWVKITRSGSTLTGSCSPNGTSWTQVGTATIAMASTIQIGLAVTSHLDGTLATGTFDNVSISSGATCTPTTCSALGKNCGSVGDGCGGTLSCGTCTSPETCGGGGTPNVCGGGTCTPETDAAFCTRVGKNCGSVTGTDNCGAGRTVTSCGTCTSPQTCGGGGTANVCGGGSSSSCSFTVTQNSYDGPNFWGTVAFTNNGPSSASNYSVEFDVRTGTHCTNDTVPAGAVLSPLTGSGTSAHTTSNHCVFTWTNTTALASGASKSFNYSTDGNVSFDAKTSTVIHDSVCAP